MRSPDAFIVQVCVDTLSVGRSRDLGSWVCTHRYRCQTTTPGKRGTTPTNTRYPCSLLGGQGHGLKENAHLSPLRPGALVRWVGFSRFVILTPTLRGFKPIHFKQGYSPQSFFKVRCYKSSTE